MLLGFAALPDRGASLPYDIPGIFTTCSEALPRLPVHTYAYGMAMWAGSELNLELPDVTHDAIDRILKNREGWRGFTVQDIGLLLSGIAHYSQRDLRYRRAGEELYAYFLEHYGPTKSGLFYNNVSGPRKQLATFATGVYGALACFHFGEYYGDDRAIARGLRCAEALGTRQGPMGEWPWFYDADSGRVVDPYQVYSVHQDGMAPAYLHLAERHGYRDARRQIEVGFEWVLGANEMEASMLVPDLGVILRSQVRNQRAQRHRRAVRGLVNAAIGRESSYVGKDRLRVNRECRSYHLGWVLHSFGGRSDYPDITENRAFVRSAMEAVT